MSGLDDSLSRDGIEHTPGHTPAACVRRFVWLTVVLRRPDQPVHLDRRPDRMLI